MSEESFILVSLKEDKAKKLAQVITNQTSRKILDCLAKKEASESDIAKELDVPISTIHYSLKQLKEVNLVQVDEFHYSKKGKVVDHYKLSNKTVIIAPQSTNVESFKEKLKKLVPAVLVSAVFVGLMKFFAFSGQTNSLNAAGSMRTVMYDTVADDVVSAKAAPVMVESFNETVGLTISPVMWVTIGCLVALATYFITDLIITRIKRGSKK